jgi:hypothetical protein
MFCPNVGLFCLKVGLFYPGAKAAVAEAARLLGFARAAKPLEADSQSTRAVAKIFDDGLKCRQRLRIISSRHKTSQFAPYHGTEKSHDLR